MIKMRVGLYISLALIALFTLLMTGCETSIDSKYSTRWFFKGEDDPYKSRASGPTSQHGFTSFYKEESESK